MTYFEAIFLGLVQGLTEFLPISSSGHLVLFRKVLNINVEAGGVMFDVALHFATLVAVMVVLKKEIIDLIKRPFQKLTLFLVIATIPAALAGVFLNDIIENVFQGGFLSIGFLVTAVALWLADSMKNTKRDMDWVNTKDATVIGLTQAVAVIPGISRSGSTLVAGLFCGLKREAAMRFSFLMSIPVILGASLMDVKELFDGTNASIGSGPLIVGMIVAAVSGYLSVKFMLNIFKKKSLKVFAVYAFVLGALILLDQLVFNVFFKGFGL